MKLLEAFNMGVDLMSDYGLVDDGWTFGFDRAINRFGVTKFGPKRITISKGLTQANNEAVVKNVILHEIAHALAGPFCGHGSHWRKIALQIGCDGERVQRKAEHVKPKWVSTCPNGHRAFKNRRARNVSCGRCSDTFNPAYRLVYTPNV